jgi:hypothetical protein
VAVEFSYKGEASVSGKEVTFDVGIKASSNASVTWLAIGVRGPKGENLDLGHAGGNVSVAIPTTWWLTNKVTATLPPGTYTYGVVFMRNGTWQGEGPKARTFTIAEPAETTSMPKGTVVSGGRTWTQTLAQDFNTPAALGEFAGKYQGWAGYDWAEDTSRNLGRPMGKRGLYNSYETVTVKDSVLDVHVHTKDGQPTVCAITPVTPEYGQLYGRFTVRWRSDSVPGYKVAWLLWPNSEVWADGEIDFPEGELGGEIQGYSHDTKGNPNANAWVVNTGEASTDWHITTIEWAPGILRYIIDGKVYETTNASAIPTKPMHWVLQTETQLSATPPSPTAQGHVQIDWVAVYKLA